MKLWAETGNHPGMFAVNFSGRISLVPYRMLEILMENGTKSISEIEMRRYGRTFEQWCYSQHRMDKGGHKMKVTISNELYIQDPLPELIRWTRENLVISNPEYSKKQRMGLWTGNTEPQLYLF